MENARVLLVDDDPAVLRMLTRVFELRGFETKTARDGRDGRELFETQRFDCVVSDVHMPGYGGMEFLRSVRELDADMPVVIMTGKPNLDTSMKAVEYGAFRYLAKPVQGNAVADLVEQGVRAFQLAKLKREALRLHTTQSASIVARAGDEASFGCALEKLWLALQPIVSWRDKHVFGYEALVRSDAATHRTPDLLLKSAEELGKLEQLGCRIRGLAASTRLPENALIFVNLHPRDLLSEELFGDDAPLTRIARRVVLEITERASLDDIDGVEARLSRLRERGFKIAVDDLGAGYAGLTSLMQLQPDIAKIDMSLIRGIDQQPRKQAIVRSLVWLCKELGITVVAEGIETAAERDTLVGLECDLLQGYLFGRPTREIISPTF